MTGFLRKYWFGLLLFMVWGFLVVFFEPWQERFYLEADMEPFKKTLQSVLLILEACFAGVVMVLALRKRRDLVLRFLLFLIIGLGLFYFFVQSTFTSVGLFINRQHAGKDVDRAYVVKYYQTGAANSRSNFFLYDLGKQEVMLEDKLVDPVFALGFGQDDTIVVKFKKGLLGVAYFDTIDASKKSD